ncbi:MULTISPECIES: hypothetical protein [Streptomyces]|uniref:MYXO-CTERM domain-containing protein n=2 Tax=Streptomyces griseoaurantiacus TaxID=68213 RepID=A0ABZ1V2H8_9ACTN|nr:MULTISPECIES: hypothetical protein [Streptomyces]MBA5225165.1 hypothetical protein [Streptomyces griseoaurantiacus]
MIRRTAVVTAGLVMAGAFLGVGAPGAGAVAKDVPDLAIVIPGDSARTRTVRSGDTGFARLWDLFRPDETESEAVPPEWREGRYPRARATVVWGLTGIGGWPYTERAPGGDVAIERQDQVFLAEDGTPWIRSDPAPDVADDDVRWHRGARKVYDRLEKAGMFGPAERPGESGAGLRARWALWGALAGVALGGGGAWGLRRWSARRDAEPVAREPRQELIDL